MDKKDGSEHPLKSLYALVCCFKRFFEQYGIHDINRLRLDDSRFGNFRVTLDAEMKSFHRKVFGTSSKQAEPITPDKEFLLWTSGQLGTHSVKVFLNTIYFYNCKVFWMRSYDKHRNIKCAQLQKKLDEKGWVYIDFGSKTNRGDLKHMKWLISSVRKYERCRKLCGEQNFHFIPSMVTSVI